MMKIFIVLLTVGVASAGQKIPWWHIKAAQEQGPNVCAIEQVPGTNRKYFTECKYWRPRSICGKETMIKYECCEGYQMVPGQLGCTGVKPLADVVETARNAGARKFAQFLEKTGVAGELGRGPAVTLFAPSDEAFDNYLRIFGDIKPQKIRDKRYRDLAMYHFVDKRVPTKQWGADLLIDSKLPGYKIRLNKYSNGMETVNCEAVLRKNQQATNGVVHIINSILSPERYEDVSIFEAMVTDGRFNILVEALRNSDIIKRLEARKTSLTFFAPSDEAFQKIPADRLKEFFENKDTLEAIVASHIIEHPICLPGLISKHHGQTLSLRKLTLDCDSRGATVENLILRKDFVHGLNGLIYLIDDVLLPDRAKTVTELAGGEELDAFMELMKKAGLEETLNKLESFTMFAPSEAAMRSVPKLELQTMADDIENAKKFVLDHIVIGRHTTDSIYDNQVVTSLNETSSLRFQVYRGIIGIEDATIVKADRVGRNGVLHIINKVLRPNSNSLEEVLRSNGNFSIWLAAMDKMREVEPQGFEEFRQSPESVSYTYFVPSDKAFTELGEAELGRLMNNSTYLSETMRNHIADDMMASGGFRRDLQYFVNTKQNTVDIVKRDNVMKVNHATLTKCDMLNRNGVAHEINKVLLPGEDVKRRRFPEKRRRVRWTKTSRVAYSRNNRLI